MDRRPPNPRRLSRQLFGGEKPIVRPVLSFQSTMEVSARKGSARKRPLPAKSRIVGPEIVRPTLRSDLGGIAVREGEELLTFAGFKNAYDRGLLKGSSKYFDIPDGSGGIWKGYERDVRLKDAASDRDAYVKWRLSMGLPARNEPPEDATEQQRKDYYFGLREILRESIANPKYSDSGEDNILESISFGSGVRDNAKSKLEKRLGEMTRAQQRKKGRVIVDGKTGPQRTTLDRIKEEDVWKSEWRRYEYKGDEKVEPYHIPEPSGKITYKVPVNIPKEYTDYVESEKLWDVAKKKFDKVRKGIDYFEDYKDELPKIVSYGEKYVLMGEDFKKANDPKNLLRHNYLLGGMSDKTEEYKKDAGLGGKTDAEVIEKLFPFITPEERKRLIRIRGDMTSSFEDVKKYKRLGYHEERALKGKAEKDTTYKTETKRFNSKKELEEELRYVKENVIGGLRGTPLGERGQKISKAEIKKAVEFDDPKWKNHFLKKYDSWEQPYLHSYSGDEPKGYTGGTTPLFRSDERLAKMALQTIAFPEGGTTKVKAVNKLPLVSIDTDVPLKRGKKEGKKGFYPVKMTRTMVKKEGRFKPAQDFYNMGGGRFIMTGKPFYEKSVKRTPYRVAKKKSAMRNPDFTMSVARGKGRRVFHIEEAETKGWKQTGVNEYSKQSENWKALDTDSTPVATLRGLRDRRTHGARLIGRGVNPRNLDRSKGYKSARDEALIQMRINETTGVRDAKSKAEKEIKNIRISEAQKALNLKLAKETAEKTTEGLKAKNAGLTHSYNVNIRNQTAATLLGSNPDELNILLKKGGGLALVKEMIRKGEIADVSTIGQLNVSKKQKDGLLRLFNEGGEFIEGKEYFFRDLDEFGQTKTRRGYLNRGGERKDNLELMYLTQNDDGSVGKERFLVPKGNILKPDDYTSTTASGKQQSKEGPEQLSQFELELYGDSPPKTTAAKTAKTDAKSFSLVKSKGAGIADPSPKPQSSIFGTSGFDSLGGDLELQLEPSPQPEPELAGSVSSDDFEFGGDAPLEPEPAPISMYGPSPKAQKLAGQIDDVLEDFQLGGAEDIADTLGEGMPDKPATDEIMAELEKALVDVDEEGNLTSALEEASPQTKSFIEGDTSLEDLVGDIKSKPKKVEFEEKPEVKAISTDLFENTTKPPSDLEGWSGNQSLPDTLFREDVDMRSSAARRKAFSPLVEGQTLLWSTKYGDKSKQRVLILDQQRADVIFRELRNIRLKDDKGKEKGLSDKAIKRLYKNVSGNITAGKRETAFNDKQLLRALDMIDLYEEDEED